MLFIPGGLIGLALTILAGRLSDRIGRKPMTFAIIAFAGIGFALFYSGAGPAFLIPPLWVLSFFGFFSGDALMAGFAMEIVPTRYRATVSGLRYLVEILAGALRWRWKDGFTIISMAMAPRSRPCWSPFPSPWSRSCSCPNRREKPWKKWPLNRDGKGILPPRQSPAIHRALMTSASLPPILKTSHLLGIEGLSVPEVTGLLDLGESYVAQSRASNKKAALLKGRTLINLFFEASTRTQSSFELAGKRLGADVLNMSVKTSSVSKGETLIDTASTLNAMRPDILVVRHQDSGAAELLSRKLDCSVVNAGDGAHEHPDPGAAGRAHHPPPAWPHRGPDRGDLRRHPAFAGGALQHPPAGDAGRASAADRAAHACCRPKPNASGSKFSPT